MRKILVTAAAIALGASLSAQAYITSPAGVMTKAGNYYGLDYGFYLTVFGGHTQQGDNRIKGTATAMLEICWRTSKAYNYSSYANIGRKWTNFSMQMGHTDFTKWTSKFSMNRIGANTTVYSGAFSLPDHTANTATQPWGDAGCVKFSKMFMYNGKNDLLQEYNSTGGGAHSNGYTSIRPYYVDNCRDFSTNTLLYMYPGSPYSTPGGAYLPSTPFNKLGKNCTDSGQTTTYYDAYSYWYGYLYNDNYSITSLRCLLRTTSSYARYMAKSAGWIGALTVGGSDAGVPIPGAKCQKLHVNMGFPLAIVGGTTTTSGHTSGNSFPNNKYIKYNKAWAGTCLYWQHAWTDTKTKQLALTVANRICIPTKGGKPTCPVGYAYAYRYKSFAADTTYSPSNTDASYGFFGRSTTGQSTLSQYKRIRTK